MGIDARSIQTVQDLFKDGATIPFVARYRKEVSGGLDEVQLRALEKGFRDLEFLVILANEARELKQHP